MKTEQAIRKLGQTLWDILGREYIDKYCEDKNGNLVSVSSISVEDIAEELVNAGYGDVSEYKAEIERLRQEVRDTDKMARNTIEQYRAENEELGNALKQSEDNYSRAFERLKAQGREIGKLKDENEALKNDLINSEGNLNHITTEIERLKEETSNIRKETAREILSRIKLYATDSKSDLIDLIDEIANANGVEVEE